MPGGVLNAEDLSFTAVMASTWPLALAVVTITLLSLHQKELFEDERWFLVTALAILVVAGVVGCGAILESVAAPEGVYELPGHPFAALAYMAFLTVGAFGIVYGPVLCIISVAMSIWAGHWIEEQSQRHMSI